MKYFFFLLIANAIGFAAQAENSEPLPKTVPTSFRSIYVPRGFDTNDNVQLAAEGIFTSSCFKVAPPIVKVNEQNKIITLDAQAYQYKGMCLQMLIPFQQIVDVGIVKTAGTYKIQTSDGRQMGQVEVKKSLTTNADDYLYAPVFRVSFEDGIDNKVSMRIEFNHSCLQLSEIKVDKQGRVIVMQPIAKILPDFGCAIGYYPVEETVKLGRLERGRYLLHVRSSGSQAFNQIITVDK